MNEVHVSMELQNKTLGEVSQHPRSFEFITAGGHSTLETPLSALVNKPGGLVFW